MDTDDDTRSQWPTILGVSVGSLVGGVVALFVLLTVGFLVAGGGARASWGVELVRALEKALWVMTLGLVKPQTRIKRQ